MVSLGVQNLRNTTGTPAAGAHPVNDVSYLLEGGETLGIVGEDGNGKSVYVSATLGLIAKPACREEGGEEIFEGQDLLPLWEPRLRSLRAGRIALVFQSLGADSRRAFVTTHAFRAWRSSCRFILTLKRRHFLSSHFDLSYAYVSIQMSSR